MLVPGLEEGSRSGRGELRIRRALPPSSAKTLTPWSCTATRMSDGRCKPQTLKDKTTIPTLEAYWL